MPSNISQVRLGFPILGIARNYGLNEQGARTTPACLNVWPIDSPSGRFRGGVRPGFVDIGGVGSGPYNGCRISYYRASDTTLKIGVAQTNATGTYVSYDGGSFSLVLDDVDPGSLTFPKTASCAMHNGYLYQACNKGASTNVKRINLAGGGTEETLPATGGSSGSTPVGYGIIVRHLDRIWLLNKLDAPHQITASAVGDPTNWDYTDPTAGGAFINTGSEGGFPGEPALAAISMNENTLLFGGPTSIYSIRGNPKRGTIRRISPHLGPLMQEAWCLGGDGYVYFMSPMGLYRIPPGDGAPPEPCGVEIPNELLGLNPYDGDRIAVGYDHRWKMVHVFAYNGTTDVSYAFKLPSKDYPGGWFKQSFAVSIRNCLTFPELISGDAGSMLAVTGPSGDVYQFNRLDETEEYDSYVVIGPILLGDGVSSGVIHALTASLGKFSDLWGGTYSGTINFGVYLAESVEAAYAQIFPEGDDDDDLGDREPFFEGTWTRAGWNYRQHIRGRGNACYIVIRDVDDEKWALEELVAEIVRPFKRLVQSGEAIIPPEP